MDSTDFYNLELVLSLGKSSPQEIANTIRFQGIYILDRVGQLRQLGSDDEFEGMRISGAIDIIEKHVAKKDPYPIPNELSLLLNRAPEEPAKVNPLLMKRKVYGWPKDKIPDFKSISETLDQLEKQKEIKMPRSDNSIWAAFIGLMDRFYGEKTNLDDESKIKELRADLELAQVHFEDKTFKRMIESLKESLK